MADDEQFYATVADEIERGQIDKVLWTKAFAHSGGEETATKSHYCRLRAEQLQKAAKKQDRGVQLAHTKTHGKQFGFGVFLFAIGLVVTAVSYNAAEPGGHYIVSRGLLIGGFVAICKGLWGLLRSPFIRAAPSDASTVPNNSGVTKDATPKATSAEQPAQATSDSSPPPLSAPEPQKPGQISQETGCFIILISTVVIVGLITWAASNSGSNAPAQVAAPPVSSPTIDPATAQRAALDKTFSDLEAEYRALAARRANLPPNDSVRLEAFNRDAANYTRKVEQARAEKARLQK